MVAADHPPVYTESQGNPEYAPDGRARARTGCPAGEEDARVAYSRIGNYANPDHPELDDFGDCSIVGAKGSTAGYHMKCNT